MTLIGDTRKLNGQPILLAHNPAAAQPAPLAIGQSVKEPCGRIMAASALLSFSARADLAAGTCVAPAYDWSSELIMLRHIKNCRLSNLVR
jgi:hypothetical protein